MITSADKVDIINLLEVENQCATTARSFGNGWQRSRMLTALASKQIVTHLSHFLLLENYYIVALSIN